MYVLDFEFFYVIRGPQGFKTFFMFNSTEHEILTANKN